MWRYLICSARELTYQVERDVYFERNLQSTSRNVQSRLQTRRVPGVADLVAVVGYFTEHSHVWTPWTVLWLTTQSRKAAPWRTDVRVSGRSGRHPALRMSTCSFRKKREKSRPSLYNNTKMINRIVIIILWLYLLLVLLFSHPKYANNVIQSEIFKNKKYNFIIKLQAWSFYFYSNIWNISHFLWKTGRPIWAPCGARVCVSA